MSPALTRLRQKMREKQLDYYLVGSSDPHGNEYVPEHWRYLAEVSGFCGSSGHLLVGQNFAGLWVDSRYHIQAERECSAGIEVFRLGQPGVPALHEYWQACVAATKLRLGLDGSCFSRRSLYKLLTVAEADSESLVTDELWERPPFSTTPVYSYGLEYCGQSRRDKIDQVRGLLREQGRNYYPIPFLDNIAWLLNVRASDIPYNPFAISYLLLGQQSLCWYIGKERIGLELERELRREIPELELKPYDQFYRDCQTLAQERPRVLLSNRCNMKLLGIFPSAEGRDIIADQKAYKNPIEQQQLRKIMAMDGAVLVACHTWLREDGMAQNLTEYQIGQKLMEYRREIAAEQGRGESFAPIVAAGPSSALPHYSASPEASHTVGGGWLLLDSGGQYLGGTTDMTRCFWLGAGLPSRELCRLYTIVLRGHLLLQNCRFPRGTLGVQLDAIARSPLWLAGLDYQHGTGHGVGSFLSVHEGPPWLSPLVLSETLEAGMLVSNEPAYYREGCFGIRIENLLLVQEASPGWLCFEPVSMFPYERELICIESLSPQERLWVDQYHAQCQEQILSCNQLNARQEAWLRLRCAPLA